MHVAVGSENPAKVAATERALGAHLDAEVTAIAVDSGVPEQPRGHEQTLAGARTRAERALAAVRETTDGECDPALGVGIEGGVAEFPGTEGLFLVMWAAITDGHRTGPGSGPAIPLPAALAERVTGGEELGPVLDDVVGTEGIAREVGAAGVLTDGIIDRESALVHAVAAAAGPFVTDFYE